MSTLRTMKPSQALPEQAHPSPFGVAPVKLRLRPRQRIELDQGGPRWNGSDRGSPEHLFVVESGCLIVDADIPNVGRQILLVLYPGDAIAGSLVPRLGAAGLTACGPCIVERVRLDDGRSGDTAVGPGSMACHAALKRLVLRSSLHGLTVGRLSGEERVATLLIEAALNLGAVTPAGHRFALPLSRQDMAGYLALNPDTLSRLLSRLKGRNVIEVPSRRVVVVRDLAGLVAMSPLGEALRDLHPCPAGSFQR